MKRIVLCADDYGQAPHISEAIINLAHQHRISATSCLVTGKYWCEHGEWLQPLQDKIDIGLHFNLTQGNALSKEFIQYYGKNFFSLNLLICKSVLRTLKKSVIIAECHAQLQAFIAVQNRLPDFIDGHQHIHQFPTIREAVLQAHAQYLQKNQSYIRLINQRLRISDVFKNRKKLIIHYLGTNEMKKSLEQMKVSHNSVFAGVYPFQQAQNYRSWFNYFLQDMPSKGGMIMIHPGLANDDKSDPMGLVSLQEYRYFCSAEFLTDCKKNGVSIARFKL